jgi:pimeloyl-ACP methyl ester carboxylesterase
MKVTFDLWRRLIAIDPELFMRYALADGYTAAGLEVLEPMFEAVVGMAAIAVQPGSDAQLELDIRIDIEDSLGRIKAPCLVIGGLEDRWVDITKSRHIAATVHGSRLIELPAGHLVIGELAADIAAALSKHVG